MHGNDRLHVGAGARQIENGEAAEAEADRGAPADVADRAPVGFPRHGIERGSDAPAHARDVGHERRQERHRILGADRAVALAEHVGHEHHIALVRQHLAGLDRRLDDAAPVRRHQQQRPRRLDAFVPHQRPTAADPGHRIKDALDRHPAHPLHAQPLSRAPGSGAAPVSRPRLRGGGGLLTRRGSAGTEGAGSPWSCSSRRGYLIASQSSAGCRKPKSQPRSAPRISRA